MATTLTLTESNAAARPPDAGFTFNEEFLGVFIQRKQIAHLFLFDGLFSASELQPFLSLDLDGGV